MIVFYGVLTQKILIDTESGSLMKSTQKWHVITCIQLLNTI